MRITSLTGLILTLAYLPAYAAGVKVENAWARATAPGQPVGAAFMDLTADADLALVGARSPASKLVELHTMSMDKGVMIMRQVERIDLPKGKTVSLKPGGLHIMLIELNAPVRAEERARITLVVRDKQGKPEEINVDVPVRAMGPMTGQRN